MAKAKGGWIVNPHGPVPKIEDNLGASLPRLHNRPDGHVTFRNRQAAAKIILRHLAIPFVIEVRTTRASRRPRARPRKADCFHTSSTPVSRTRNQTHETPSIHRSHPP